MRPFTIHTGIAAPLLQANLDTDQIIPARFLHRARDEGYGDQLFHDLRRNDDGEPMPGFILNRHPFDQATILIAGSNFGCGSSREHAVWALGDAGFRVVVAPSFGDIFFNNALNNGLLTIVAPPEILRTLADGLAADPTMPLTANLKEQTVDGPDGFRFAFDIDPYRKQALLIGASEIQMTLQHGDAIRSFETAHARRHPWLVPSLPTNTRKGAEANG